MHDEEISHNERRIDATLFIKRFHVWETLYTHNFNAVPKIHF